MLIKRRALLVLPGAIWLSGCVGFRDSLSAQLANDPVFADIEKKIGGRVGAALLSVDGRVIASHRAHERFAMCSTFKLPLAALQLQAHDNKLIDNQKALQLSEADLVPYAPYVETLLANNQSTTLEELSREAVIISDNAAANVVLRAVGGPEALTAFMRSKGDAVSRLDRYEPELNENKVGDPRDTTSPLAMAGLLHKLLVSKDANPKHKVLLTDWMMKVRTGDRRIRAGVPEGWKVGDKTGTAPQSAPAYNDIAILMPPAHPPYILTAYLDRSSVPAREADAAIASIAQHAAEIILATDAQV